MVMLPKWLKWLEVAMIAEMTNKTRTLTRL